MEISEIKQLQINATKARMGAVIGTYNAKSVTGAISSSAISLPAVSLSDAG